MTFTHDLAETEAFLHEQIPLTAAMGVKLGRNKGGELVITAPLAPNHNHLNTALGGSLSALATVAGYAFLWLELGDRDSHIVIRESSLSFQKPVRGEIRALCVRPADSVLKTFKAAFAAKGKARIRLEVIIEESGETAVRFQGTYVALK